MLNLVTGDGGWSSWEPSGLCNAPCGVGVQDIARYCTAPLPTNGGADCEGISSDYTLCLSPPCPSKLRPYGL